VRGGGEAKYLPITEKVVCAYGEDDDIFVKFVADGYVLEDGADFHAAATGSTREPPARRRPRSRRTP
jgi:hypothetical protein